MSRPSILRVREVGVVHGRRTAVDAVDLTLRRGTTAVVGVNGAGKTSLLRVLAGVVAPSEGVVEVDGQVLGSRAARSRYRHHVGYLPQDPRWPGEVTVGDLLTYFARLRMPRGTDVGKYVRSALEAVDLVAESRTRLRELSGGQRRRAFLAQAVVHDPAVLVVDEPTAGLDPVQRLAFRELVRRSAEARLVVLATHLLDDVDRVADRVAVLDAGRLVWEGEPLALAASGGAGQGPDDQRSEDGASALERGLLHVLGLRDDRPGGLAGPRRRPGDARGGA